MLGVEGCKSEGPENRGSIEASIILVDHEQHIVQGR